MRRAVALLVVLLASACARERARPPGSPAPQPPAPVAPSPRPVAVPAPPPAAAPPASGPTCEVLIEIFGKPYEGEATGNGSSNDADDKKAWALACGAMQKAEGVGCDDEERYTYVITTRTSVIKGKTSRRVQITVRPRLDQRTRTASSPAGWREACFEAVKQACSPGVPHQSCDPGTVSCKAEGDSARCRPIRERPFRPDAERIVDPTPSPF